MDKPAARSRPVKHALAPAKARTKPKHDTAEKRPRGRPRKTLDERDDFRVTASRSGPVG